MIMARIKAPNRDFNGRIGEVIFRDGVAETDDIAVIQYCRGAGYEVDSTTDNPAPGSPEPADPRKVTTDVPGTRLRDAAVDPKPTDFLPPTNAGQANPHGPDVVAPGVHATPPGPIVPGTVLDDPGAQEARETEAAERTLAGDEPVPDVTADMAKQQSEADRIAAEPPAGNASQEDWATWVIATHPGIDEAEVQAMKRDQLRDTYGPNAG